MRVGGVLPYYFEVGLGESGMTALAGLLPYLDLAHVAQVRGSVERHLQLRENGQGGTPAQLLLHSDRASYSPLGYPFKRSSRRLQARRA